MIEPRGVRLRALDGQTFRFDPGAFCLEFALTGGEGYRAAYERLHTPDDLRRWIQAAFGAPVERVTDDDLAEAKRLREAIWRCADARVEGRQPSRGEVGEVNRAAARPPLTPRIDGSGRRAWATPVTPAQALSVVARDAVGLFGGPLARRIRRCAGERCTLVFVDASRAGRRRWCSMDRCGNRAKVRAFRDRRQQQEEEAP
jgi:predicted RNA-binding Zn ribbon-like protein